MGNSGGGSDLSHLEGRLWALLKSDYVVMVCLGVEEKRRRGEEAEQEEVGGFWIFKPEMRGSSTSQPNAVPQARASQGRVRTNSVALKLAGALFVVSGLPGPAALAPFAPPDRVSHTLPSHAKAGVSRSDW